LGRIPESGATRSLIVASNSGYGLTTGSYASDFLSLTEVGVSLAVAPNEIERNKIIYDILFKNVLFSGLVSRFKDRGIPEDEVVADYLVQTHGLAPADAIAFWVVAKANLLDFKIVQQLSGKTIIVSREQALESLAPKGKIDSDPLEGVEPERYVEKPITHVPADIKKLTHSEQLLPQFTFNIQIVLPENSSPDTYDNIFKSIATHLLYRDNG